jgi:spoIIIJ-associated protein
MAVEATDKVIEDRKKQILEPMSALERRIVHMALKDVNGVVTHSEGREPYRRIVISPTE